MNTTTNTDLFNTLKSLYKDGRKIKIIFTKKDNTERTMIVQRDLVMESEVKGVITTKKSDDHLRVVEITEDGAKQWRSVRDGSLISVEEISV